MFKNHQSAFAHGRRALLGGAATLALCGTALGQAPGDNNPDLEGRLSLQDEIIVTAQKRATTLQDTPLAITAFTGDSLENRGLVDISDLESSVPQLHVGQEQDGFKVSIRGIGLQGTSSISDSGVAFYVDGFYQPRPSGGSATFFDVDRVEVLRGPQGTLYGRNATGGVINIIANKPELGEDSGQLGVSVGSRNLFEGRAVANMAISENVAARATIVYREEDGYTVNEFREGGDDDLFGRDGDFSARGQVRYVPTDATDLLVSLSFSDLKGTGVPLKYLERNIGGPGPTQAFFRTLPDDIDDPLRVSNDALQFNDTETLQTFVRATHDFGGVEGFFQGGYLTQDTALRQDIDGSPLDISVFEKTLENESYSLEARIASDTGSPLSWIAGGYYFEEETDLKRIVLLNGLVGPPTMQMQIALPNFDLDESGSSKTAALFGSATYQLTEQFSVTGGLRYTEDDRGGTKITNSNFGRPAPPDLIDLSVNYNKVTWKAGVEFEPNADFLGYASISNGYKAGGFNLTNNGQPYDPEDVIAYEAGFKSNPMNGRAQFNLDAFYYDYTDLQLSALVTVNNAPGQLVTNAAETTIAGVEMSGHFNLTEDLRLLGSYAYLDAEFDELLNSDPRDRGANAVPGDPLGRQDLSGNRLPYTAKNTFSLGLNYVTDLANGHQIGASILTNWHDDMFLREFNDPDIDLVDAQTQTDASVTYRFNNGVKLTGYVTNIEDETEKNNIQISPGFVGNSALAAYTQPRTFGARLDVNF